ncbi:MAG: lipoprotein signal peptidase [Candidatus Doudnabacteria bacterium]|nr:lipoprotein signal peptidase [Candidatus Doudnabacteria bacterium]
MFFLFVLVDQASKLWVIQHGSCGELACSYFKNDNFAFSLKVAHPIAYFIYAILLAALIVWFAKKKNKTTLINLSFVLILSGALSNIGERLVRGYVVDFIKIHTGVLNFADFFIIAGILILVFEKPTQN